MTTFDTGNPVGSASPKDLYDNAENLDVAVNSPTEETWVDRLGTTRKSWHGMEQDFQQFLAESGYVGTGAGGAYEDYDADGPLTIGAYNEIFTKSGDFYRAKAGTSFPYTTTGTWGTDETDFVSIGDAALRSDLATPDSGPLVDPTNIDADLAQYADDISAIESLAGMVNGQSVYVSAERRTYVYDSASTEDAFENSVIEPAGAPPAGRWLLQPLDRDVFDLSAEEDAPYGTEGTFLVSTPPRYVDGSRAALTPPEGFNWTPPILPVFAAGKWTGSVSARSIMPAADGVEYFVDAMNGSDSNPGTEALPFQRPSFALQQADVGVVTIAPNPIVLAEGNFGNITPTTTADHVIIRPWKQVGRSGRVSSTHGLFHRYTDWVSSGAAYERTFKTAISGVALVKRVLDYSVRDEDGQPIEYNLEPSVAAAETRPGGWYYDDVAGELHIHALTGSVPGANVVCPMSGTNFYWNSSKPIYIQGVDFIGGQSPVWFPEDATDVYMLDCSITAGLGNNFSYYGTGTAIMEDCKSMMSIRDGFNYHKSPNSGVLPNAIEINCTIVSAGCEPGVDSHQCSTMHDGGAILRIGGYYGGAQTQCTGDVSVGTRSWGVGVEYGRSWQTGGNNVSAYISDGEMWLYDCNMGGSDVSVSVSNDATLYLHNTPIRGRYNAAVDIQGYVQS